MLISQVNIVDRIATDDILNGITIYPYTLTGPGVLAFDLYCIDIHIRVEVSNLVIRDLGAGVLSINPNSGNSHRVPVPSQMSNDTIGYLDVSNGFVISTLD